MRPQNKSRSRNKPGSNGHSGNSSNNNNNNNQRRSGMGNIINRVFESAGPDGKVRGTPQQIIDKYQALARDAQVSGDRVAAESFLQYSEHYTRILGEAQRQQMETRYQGDREDGQQQREDGQQQREDGSQQRDESYDRRPQQQPQPQGNQQGNQRSQPSGLAMIDPADGDDYSGPIETPESRRDRRRDPLPVADPQPTFEPPAFMAMPMPVPVDTPEPAEDVQAPDQGAEPAAEAASAEPEAPPVRKSRPRKRKPAAEVIGDTSAASGSDTPNADTPVTDAPPVSEEA